MITTTRFGSAVPRWIATTSTTSVGCEMRGPVTVCETIFTSRQPPHCAAMSVKRACTQRRAAPMPRVWLCVSDSVWRVPKPTSVSIVDRSCAGSTARLTSSSSTASAACAESADARVSVVAAARRDISGMAGSGGRKRVAV